MVYVRHLSFVEMEAAKLRVQVCAFVAQQKKKEDNKTREGASSSAPKAIGKSAHKRKNDGKDDCPPNKPSVGDKSLKKSMPPRLAMGLVRV